MTDTAPSFPTLLQRFFVDHLRQQRAVSPCTVAAYRDTFKLLLAFAEKRIGKSPTDITARPQRRPNPGLLGPPRA